MIVLNTKNFDELTDESLAELRSLGFSTKAGSIAKLFLNIINKNIANLYDTLTINHLRAFLSTSDTDALEAIGELLRCERNTNESDDAYKERISEQCLTLASSNETAIKSIINNGDIEGIEDIKLKPYAMGSGTFSIIVITDPSYEQSKVLEAVKQKLNETVGYGIRFKVDSPTLTPVKISIRLNIGNGLSNLKKQEIRYDVKYALADYFTALAVGEDISVDKITQAIMNVNENILSYQTVSFNIGGEKAIFVNQSCRWFERFYLSSDIDNIIVQ